MCLTSQKTAANGTTESVGREKLWTIVFIILLNIFRNAYSCENWGIFSEIPQFWLGNIRTSASEDIWWILMIDKRKSCSINQSINQSVNFNLIHQSINFNEGLRFGVFSLGFVPTHFESVWRRSSLQTSHECFWSPFNGNELRTVYVMALAYLGLR